MKKFISTLFLLAIYLTIYAQNNSSRTGTGSVEIKVNKNSVYVTQTVSVSAQAISSEEADGIRQSYPGYHTTVEEKATGSTQQKKQVIQVINVANESPQNKQSEKRSQSTAPDNTKQNKVEITNNVIKIE